MNTENINIAREFEIAWNMQTTERLEKFLHPQLIFENRRSEKRIQGKSELLGYLNEKFYLTEQGDIECVGSFLDTSQLILLQLERFTSDFHKTDPNKWMWSLDIDHQYTWRIVVENSLIIKVICSETDDPEELILDDSPKAETRLLMALTNLVFVHESKLNERIASLKQYLIGKPKPYQSGYILETSGWIDLGDSSMRNYFAKPESWALNKPLNEYVFDNRNSIRLRILSEEDYEKEIS